MIDFATVAPAIRDAITGLGFTEHTTGAAQPSAKWSRRAQGQHSPEAKKHIEIKITNISKVGGRDETRYSVDEETNALMSHQYGMRAITVQVKVESDRDEDTTWCWATTEDIRAGLERTDILATLRESGVALIRIGDANTIDIHKDGRHLSAGVFDAVFCAALQDTPRDAGGWIETIELSSNVTKTDGSAADGNFADETLPQ